MIHIILNILNILFSSAFILLFIFYQILLNNCVNFYSIILYFISVITSVVFLYKINSFHYKLLLCLLMISIYITSSKISEIAICLSLPDKSSIFPYIIDKFILMFWMYYTYYFSNLILYEIQEDEYQPLI